ncbi:hypothetical protein FALCPG4_015928 [Fusarium falciforme]
MLLERAVGRKQPTFPWCLVSVAAMRFGGSTWTTFVVGVEATLSGRPSPQKSLEPTYRPRIVCEANKPKEGHWRKKTTRLRTVLAMRHGTFEPVWLWEVDARLSDLLRERPQRARTTRVCDKCATRGAKPTTDDTPSMIQRIATEHHMVGAGLVSRRSAGDRAGVAATRRLRCARHGRPRFGDDSR